MNAIGIILTIIVSIILFYIVFQFIYEYIWNKRLKSFQEKQNITYVRKIQYIVPLRRALIGLTSVVILFVFAVTGSFNLPSIYHDKTLVNASIAKDAKTLRLKLNRGDGFNFNNLFPQFDDMDLSNPESGASNDGPDVVGTNLQLEGVDEADIIKTDGHEIFYTPSMQQHRMYRFKVESDGQLTQLEGLELDKAAITSFYITDDYVVVVGYKIQNIENYFKYDQDIMILPSYYFYTAHTGFVQVYQRDDLTLQFELETTGNIRQHRIIDNMFYMISYTMIDENDLRPSFVKNIGDTTQTEYVEFNQILMFDQIPAYKIMTVSAINLNTYQTHHESVVGVDSQIYVSHDAIYTAGSFTYYPFLNTSISGTHIIKFDLNHEAGTITYSSSTILEGFVQNQFWMDEYEGDLRVVTSRTWGVTDRNRLYILRPSDTHDTLEHIGLLDEGIGKPNENVMSVRFDKDFAYVVTYRQIDPLYTIDISNPKDIKIINEAEEPGYNTYLHVWDENHLIGIGYDEHFDIKISAYLTTNKSEPLITYSLSDQGHWHYSEALYNHKAILISPDHGFIGFAVNGDSYNYETSTYYSISKYLLFYIDFDRAEIIMEPYEINHHSTAYHNPVDRGIYINNIFYTFSSASIVTFNGDTKVVEDTYALDHPLLP